MLDYQTSNLTIQVVSPSGQNYELVEFSGDLDKAGLEKVKTQIENLIVNLSQTDLVFDLSKLNFINSESIGFFMTIHSHLMKLNKNLVLVGAKANVKDVLSVIGIFQIMSYYDSLSSFLENSKKS